MSSAENLYVNWNTYFMVVLRGKRILFKSSIYLPWVRRIKFSPWSACGFLLFSGDPEKDLWKLIQTITVLTVPDSPRQESGYVFTLPEFWFLNGNSKPFFFSLLINKHFFHPWPSLNAEGKIYTFNLKNNCLN